jgi:ubiquitin carboxyl-terminal hydrolase 34
MCKLSDADLRQAASRNMLELVWAAIKDPGMEANLEFDEGSLTLAFKYFTCTTLTIRLQGIAQINVGTSMYSETCEQQTSK